MIVCDNWHMYLYLSQSDEAERGFANSDYLETMTLSPTLVPVKKREALTEGESDGSPSYCCSGSLSESPSTPALLGSVSPHRAAADKPTVVDGVPATPKSEYVQVRFL